MRQETNQIILPHNWIPRPYQEPVFVAKEEGIKRFVLRWHRRCGKDDTGMHFTAVGAHEKVANYWHCLPEYAQARKAVWESINPHTGIRRIDEAFPLDLRTRTNNTEMLIEFKNGSTWQLIGSDNYNKNVGSTPYGVIFSEYSLSEPKAWDYIRPMLRENGGWAMFISSVRGKNHFWKLGEFAKGDPNWYFSDIKADMSGVFTQEELEIEKKELIEASMDEEEALAIFNQEYFNDPNAAMPGAYYAKLLTQAENDGRICDLPYNPNKPTITSWDLGIGDSTAIWFYQVDGYYLNIIDYYEACGVGLDHYAKYLHEKPYVYTNDNIFPHDIEVRELAEAKTRRETLAGHGIKGFVLPKLSVDEGISAVRNLLPRCRFDKTRCKRGLEALNHYHKKWDDKNKIYQSNPCHDWASHGADGFRYLALGHRELNPSGITTRYSASQRLQQELAINYNPLG